MAKFCDEKIQNHLLNGGRIKRKGIFNGSLFFKDNRLVYLYNVQENYFLCPNDLITDDWEIVETKYNWDKIIKDKILCIFSDDKNFKYKEISTLDSLAGCYYYTENLKIYKFCKPFNPAEFNIAQNLKEYEK